jgi:hypothetical protein
MRTLSGAQRTARSNLAFCLFCVALLVVTAADLGASPSRYALIVSGAPGGDVYAER